PATSSGAGSGADSSTTSTIDHGPRQAPPTPARIMSANEPARCSAGGTGDPVTQMEIGSAGASGMRNPLSDPGGAPREGAPLRPRSAVACRCEETLDDSRRLLSDLVGRWYPIVAEEQRLEEPR